MKPRAGMTLVEVLAALVLMGLVAGATLPLLRTSVSILRAPEPATSAFELERIADSVVDEPEAFGLATVPVSGDVLGPGGGTASVQLLYPRDADTEHGWLAVSSGGRTVFRWIPGPLAEETR